MFDQFALRQKPSSFLGYCFLGAYFGSYFFCYSFLSRKLKPIPGGATGLLLVTAVFLKRGLSPFCSVFCMVRQLFSYTNVVVVGLFLLMNDGGIGAVVADVAATGTES
jgi:hypothetical protein